MKFYFEESDKRFGGRPRESIVITLNKDINRAKSMNRDFPIPTLRRKEDFEHTRSIAQDRKAWRKHSHVEGEARRRKEEEGGGRRRKEEEGGGRRRKEEEGGGRRRKEEGQERRRKEEEGGRTRKEEKGGGGRMRKDEEGQERMRKEENPISLELSR